MEWTNYFTKPEKRIQIIGIIVFLVFLTSLIAFHEIEKLSSQDNYTVALHLKGSSEILKYYPTNGVLEEGDSISLLKWHYDL